MTVPLPIALTRAGTPVVAYGGWLRLRRKWVANPKARFLRMQKRAFDKGWPRERPATQA